MNMEGDRNSSDALNDAKLCVSTTETKSMASSSRPIHAFFTRSIPSLIKRAMQPRRGKAARVVSLRIARLMEHRSGYASALEFDIEASKDHWTQVDATSSEEEGNETDLDVFQSLKEKWGDFFHDYGDDLVIGEKIAEGAQAEIFEAELAVPRGNGIFKEQCILKVFKEGWALRDLQKQWPTGMLKKSDGGGYYSSNSCQIYGGLLLESGRFAFRMEKCWGDLRKLIDLRMQHNNNRSRPFSNPIAQEIMLSIAWGMWALHEHNIIHRDLKASNVLIWNFGIDRFDPVGEDDGFGCAVADFECSVGVVGTGYWRAPEILQAVQIGGIKPHIFTKESDVYSYAMTCYEVLTGCIPFEDLSGTCYDIVIEGMRPKFPDHVHPFFQTLLIRCWHDNPLARPSFKNIVEQLKILLELDRSFLKEIKFSCRNPSNWGEFGLFLQNYEQV